VNTCALDIIAAGDQLGFSNIPQTKLVLEVKMANKTEIRVALDWTPNTIHSGLFCALENGIYDAQGLDVKLLPPDQSYTSSPAKRLQNGEVDLAICPSESVIAYNETGKMKLQAIYAILQRDDSAIVSTKHQDITALAQGVYGSYNAKYEDDIVKAMVSHAGGSGNEMQIKNTKGKFSLFDEVKSGTLDATWVFMPWEGVDAELDGVSLFSFTPQDYGVPYGYSPVIARNAACSLDAETLGKFIVATASGYQHAIKDPKGTAAVLKPHCQPDKSTSFLEHSQQRINQFYLEDGAIGLGQMKAEKWKAWIAWLKERGLLKKELVEEDLFTNDFSR
jgi:ABC-type nitrate/sulfonate/bicarbonate transport system substrate-binding protein